MCVEKKKRPTFASADSYTAAAVLPVMAPADICKLSNATRHGYSLVRRLCRSYNGHVHNTRTACVHMYVRTPARLCVCKCLRKGRTPLKARAPSKVNFITGNLRPFFLLYFPFTNTRPDTSTRAAHTCRQPAISTVYTPPPFWQHRD